MEVMGVVNLTPDSFSGDGLGAQNKGAAQAALASICALVEAGADWIDLGAESTRPGATPLTSEQEWARLAPVLATLAAEPAVDRPRLSLDTRHGSTAHKALALAAQGGWGVAAINDVSGGADPALLEAVAAHGAGVMLMHSLVIPADRSVTLAPDADPVAALLAWGRSQVARMAAAGIDPGRVWLDPGLGFGKTSAQNWALVQRVGELVTGLPCPLLVGPSRKSFLGAITERPPAQRDLETQVIGLHLARAGVALIRVHDVGGMRRALTAAHAAGLL